MKSRFVVISRDSVTLQILNIYFLQLEFAKVPTFYFYENVETFFKFYLFQNGLLF
ncbi:conserved hypothetical protein [Leptospira interrogans serovar Manilae]|uniref:Uncharacterized protein n=1 Tax=Leptospira interrogans serovar Manilae TaxID=214675 RepID=A0AAQ1NYG1_LEPIR|nr:hypothetical protein LIMLP_15865 [Leptospira interrogans serovar Manilae]AKP31028.1 hypothetical protein LIMHP_15855 [Leptospira interrogans serovar Manilae]SOR60929.1 conserved hypothetical protein [Leptospira interrogans serovar Manilae]